MTTLIFGTMIGCYSDAYQGMLISDGFQTKLSLTLLFELGKLVPKSFTYEMSLSLRNE